MLFNPADHVMTPHHQRLSKAQLKELMRTHEYTPAMMPTLKRSDRMARHLGLLPGEGVVITRPDGMPFYRRVV